ncbi:hypothetical protein LU290_09005 [Moraxella nasibovis]|uniref:DNA modification system-associated small protein n=1 Tax=Moraxella nasibovis TaxID=2904120 RepID=UPI00240F98FC|nr:DNA modification system-associated small protein [Moraxella nasibovis]WFF38375.1 hypothetical protein LU290_09005 [Moraxella nasibovis]
MSKVNPQETVADLLLWNDPKTKTILDKIAQEKGIDLDALAELVDWQRRQQLVNRSSDRSSVFDRIFEHEQYWK